MRTLLFFMASLSLSAHAYDFTQYSEVALKCNAYNPGYTVAKTIDLMFLEKNHNNTKTIEYVVLNHHESFDDQGGYADPILETYYGIRSSQDENENWQFSYGIEYFDNTITVLGDDNGYKLMTSYLSDGPVEIGFYECEEVKSAGHVTDVATINAWDRLENAINADAAIDYKIEIVGKPLCGEMDPYFMGDACLYTAVRAPSEYTNEDAKTIHVYFSDYDTATLKVGDIVDVKAVPVNDFDQRFGDKPVFAVELK